MDKGTINKIHNKCFGVIWEPHWQHIDHIVPLCISFGCPLFCDSSSMQDYIYRFYPNVSFVREQDLASAESFLYLQPSKLYPGSFRWGKRLFKGNQTSFCGWHGNSSKFFDDFCWEKLLFEDTLLVYGTFMKELLESLGIWERLNNILFIGNYRLKYYHAYKETILEKIHPWIFPEKGEKTLFYAPTWTHSCEKCSSPFMDVIDDIIETIPQSYQLYIKPHPYLDCLYPKEMEKLYEKVKGNRQISLLKNIPYVFPFLEQSDVYIGDYSSVGYDYLYYNRPLYFLKGAVEDPYLFSCGVTINPKQLYEEIKAPFPKECLERGKDLYQRLYD